VGGGGSKKIRKQSFVGQITERRTEILNQESYDNSGLTLFCIYFILISISRNIRLVYIGPHQAFSA